MIGLFCINILYSQKKLYLLDALDASPVVEAILTHNNIGCYKSDSNGVIFIKDIDLSKEFIIKHLLFEDQFIKLKNSDTIYLKRKENNLNEVVFSSNKKRKIEKVRHPKNLISNFGYYKGYNTKPGLVYITYLKNNFNKQVPIKSICIETKNDYWNKDHFQNLPFKVNLCTLDSLNNIKQKLLSKDIFVTNAMNNEIEIDISKEDLYFPPEGIGILVEPFTLKEYHQMGYVVSLGPSFKILNKPKKTENFTLSIDQKKNHKRVQGFIYNFGIDVLN